MAARVSVRLWSHVTGGWRWNGYTYAASFIAPAGPDDDAGAFIDADVVDRHLPVDGWDERLASTGWKWGRRRTRSSSTARDSPA